MCKTSHCQQRLQGGRRVGEGAPRQDETEWEPLALLWCGSSSVSSTGGTIKRGFSAERLGAHRRNRHFSAGGRQEHAPVPTMRPNHRQVLLHLSYQHRPPSTHQLQPRRSRAVEDLHHAELSSWRGQSGRIG